jgi:hypothetical protein
MSPRASIAGLSAICLLGSILFLVMAAVYGHAIEGIAASIFLIISGLSSTVYTALGQVERRLKSLEDRLAKCEHSPAAPNPHM